MSMVAQMSFAMIVAITTIVRLSAVHMLNAGTGGIN